MHSLSIDDRVFHKTLPVCWTDLIPKDFLIYKICKSVPFVKLFIEFNVHVVTVR